MMYTLIDSALKLRGLVVMLMLGILAYGGYCYVETPRDAFPDISPVLVPIFAEAPGLAAEEVELKVAQPIENGMNGLPDVSLIKSTSAFGMAVVYVYFKDAVDIYFARQIVSERLNNIVLPPEVPKPELGPISTGLGQIFIYYLKGDTTRMDTQGKSTLSYLREVNDFVVKRQLQTVPGVTSILSMGGFVLQYQVKVNPVEMQRYNITFSEITEAIAANNRNVGGQYIEVGAEEYLVRGIGMLNALSDIENITLREIDGVPISIKDVGEVVYGEDIRRGVVSRNGEEEVVAGIVLKLYGENTSKVIQNLHTKLEDVQRSLPEGVTIVPYYDQADLVENAAYTVESALYQGIILVLIVLAVSLWNLRASIIVALSMPFCATLAMIGLNYFNYSANLMSLGGIAIALGMLVDGSIVVSENILRHLKLPQNQHRDKNKIILEASLEVARPIAFALMIIVAVFIPIFLFEGVEGKMFRPLAFTIVIALAGSIIAATINTPVLASFLFKQGKVAPIAEEKPSRPSLIMRLYLPLVRQAIRFRYLLFVIVLFSLMASITALSKVGREFMPSLEEGTLMITVNMAPSIGLTKAEKVIHDLERIVMNHEQVTGTVSRIGRPEAGSHPHPVNFAEIQVALKSNIGTSVGAEERKKIVEDLRTELKDYPGISLNFSQPIQNAFEELLSGTRTYFALKVYGENMDVLRNKAEEIRKVVQPIPGVVDLSVEQSYGQPQVKVELNHEAMARHGVSGDEVMKIIENAVGGQNVGAIYQNTRRYDINVRLNETYRASPEMLGKLQFKTASGRYIELNELASIIITEGPVQINREKNQRRWTIFGNIANRAPSDIVKDMRLAIAEKVQMPPGYSVEFGGQFENQERAMKKLMVIVPIVILIIFVLLWMTFKSLRNSVTVMINVPLALIGGILGLIFMNQLLSVPAAVGFIALLGIAMQDGVVMISDFKDLRAQNKTLMDAILEGSAVRFKAVILTTLTTLLGLLPLILSQGIGAEVQKPLAVIVVFGLSTSTLLTLFFLPALYYEIERLSQSLFPEKPSA